MSTYLYLECQQHNPPLRAENESGQHLYDLPNIRQDIRNRDVVAQIWREEYGGGFGYFRNNTAQFLALHADCPLGIVDEYGNHHSLLDDKERQP